MQSPKKPKYRKQMKQARRIRGKATRGNKLAFGEIGLMALEGGWITNRQIEAGRVAFTRASKRQGKSFIRVFCDKPLTKKPAETRMGKGKGSPEHWVAEVQAGRIIYELTGVPLETAKQALQLASSKMPVKTKIVYRSEFMVAA